MLMAGLDGIKRKLEPPKPIDEDLYEIHDERRKLIKQVPGSLSERSTPSRRTTSSCSRATCSRRT